MLSKHHLANKSHKHRIIYDKCLNRCPICKKIQGRSKRFDSLYQLLYHLNSHNTEDEISSGITKDSIRETVRHVAHALELGILIQ